MKIGHAHSAIFLQILMMMSPVLWFLLPPLHPAPSINSIRDPVLDLMWKFYPRLAAS